jgi:two-component system sensor histidine kinase MprB
VIRRILDFFTFHSRPLQDRLAILIAMAVGTAVAVTGVAAYLLTMWTVYTQLDEELVQVAAITRTQLSDDLESMAGIDLSTLRAANVTVMLIRSDKYQIKMPAQAKQPTLVVDSRETTIARTSFGYSARTGSDSSGSVMRIVAVPLVSNNQYYALVLGRPLAPTLAILRTMAYSLLTFGGIGGAIAAASGYVIARSGIQPVRQLSDAVARITSTGQLTPITVKGDDELAELGRSFNRMLRALQSSRERQARLIADAGHELRTPLTSMRTNVELLVADEKSGMLPPGARAEVLGDVAAQLGEFTTLVGDLVQLSREDRAETHPELFDLSDVVENALERVKRRGPNLNWDVELNPLYVLGEPDALERAVTNLLDNAVKFSPDGSTIHLKMEGDRLRIADEGEGIASEDLPHVFERFYRSEHARNAPGSGLGLSIVAQTIQAHGGWIRASKAPEGGAEFTIRLPGSPTPPEGDPTATGGVDAAGVPLGR